MELRWPKQLSVGNAILDSELQVIIRLVNEVDRAIKARDSARFAETLKRLEEATRIQFGNEARIAEAIDYRFDHHNLEHQYILNEIQSVGEEMDSKHGQWSESVAEHYYHFLSTWATEHISQDDMKMKALLVTRPYDFKPDDWAG